MLGSSIGEEFFAVEVFFDCGVFVWKNFPDLWGDEIESHWSLEVGLVELCKDSIGIIRFELSVKILFFIDIDEADAATSIIVVKVSVLDGNMVDAFLEFRNVQENESFGVIEGSFLAVDENFWDALALEIDCQLGWDGGEGESEFRKSVVVSALF